jgi:hypothetical protein
MEENQVKIRRYKANRIATFIDGRVSETDNPGLREEYRSRICTALQIGNRYTFILNNKVEPKVSELVVIAQILDTSMDTIITTE